MADLNSLLVALEPGRDAEEAAEELRDRDDVVKVDLIAEGDV